MHLDNQPYIPKMFHALWYIYSITKRWSKLLLIKSLFLFIHLDNQPYIPKMFHTLWYIYFITRRWSKLLLIKSLFLFMHLANQPYIPNMFHTLWYIYFITEMDQNFFYQVFALIHSSWHPTIYSKDVSHSWYNLFFNKEMIKIISCFWSNHFPMLYWA